MQDLEGTESDVRKKKKKAFSSKSLSFPNKKMLINNPNILPAQTSTLS